MLGFRVGKFNIKPFIVDASKITSVMDYDVEDDVVLQLKLTGTDETFHCTHFYEGSAFSKITSIHAFYDMLKEL